jgi:hypothetical protein
VQLDRFAALQRVLIDALPTALRSGCRVAYASEAYIVIEAQNGAVAAKVKALSGRLLAALRQRDPALHGIRVEVAVVRRGRIDPRPIRRIGPTGVRSLSALARALPGGALQSALRRLLAASHRQNQPFEDEKGQHHGHHDQRVLEDLPCEAQPAPILGDQIDGDRSADHQHHEKTDDA